MSNLVNNPRPYLAYIWSLFAMWAVGYALVKHGGEKEILTLLLGLIGGTVIGGIYGVYFNATHQNKQTSQQNADTIINESKE